MGRAVAADGKKKKNSHCKMPRERAPFPWITERRISGNSSLSQRPHQRIHSQHLSGVIQFLFIYPGDCPEGHQLMMPLIFHALDTSDTTALTFAKRNRKEKKFADMAAFVRIVIAFIKNLRLNKYFFGKDIV
jgi:hypothetical protein